MNKITCQGYCVCRLSNADIFVGELFTNNETFEIKNPIQIDITDSKKYSLLWHAEKGLKSDDAFNEAEILERGYCIGGFKEKLEYYMPTNEALWEVDND